jgi:hypothetical protein
VLGRGRVDLLSVLGAGVGVDFFDEGARTGAIWRFATAHICALGGFMKWAEIGITVFATEKLNLEPSVPARDTHRLVARFYITYDPIMSRAA